MCWLIMWKRIQTRSRLVKFYPQAKIKCPLCELKDETVDHIYFQCDYTKRCLEVFCQQLKIKGNFSNLSNFSDWLHKPCTGGFRKKVLQCCCAALLYHLWKQRNDAICNKKIMQPAKLIEKLKAKAFWRICSILPSKTCNKEKFWFDHLMRFKL